MLHRVRLLHSFVRKQQTRDHLSDILSAEQMPQHLNFDSLDELHQALLTRADHALVLYELPQDIQIPDQGLSSLVEHFPNTAILCIGTEEPPLDFDALDSLIEFLPDQKLTTSAMTVALRSLIARQDAKRIVKRSEEKLQIYRQDLNLTELGAGIAHDANNMLSASLGHLQKLQKTINQGGEVKSIQQLESAIAGCEHVASLLREWLAKAKNVNTPLQSDNIPVTDLVKRVAELAQPLIPERIRFDLCTSTELAITGVTHQLEQAILNLILNSVQAITDDGTIRLTASTGGDVQDPKIIIELVDTGCGISEKKIQQIFNPFYTSKEKRGGSGLGLSMVNRIVHLHQGELYVHSNEGTGTCFRILLPALEVITETDVTEETEIVEVEGNVLIIDDTAPLLEVMEDFLVDAGLSAFTYTNPQEAIEWYEQNEAEVDLILLDMQMPEMSGEECFRRLREIQPEAPIVIYSGAQDGITTRLLKEGALEFFQKPINYEETVLWIQRHIADRASSPNHG